MIAKNQIWKLYGTEYKEMTKELLSKADLAGLIGGREKRVAIKPNLVVAAPAEFGATTHPEVVAGIVEYLQENQFENIVIVESSWVGDRTSEAFIYCGYKELCEKYDVPFIDGQKDKWHEVDCAGMKLNIIDAVDAQKPQGTYSQHGEITFSPHGSAQTDRASAGRDPAGLHRCGPYLRRPGF